MPDTKILFFGILREIAGKNQSIIALPATIDDCHSLIDWIALENPSLHKSLSELTTKISVDGEIISRDETFKTPTEIAFLPPFSGG